MIEQTDVTGADWRKSSYSNGDGGNCVEVAEPGEGLLVRDSKQDRGPVLAVGGGAWAAFVGHVRGDAGR